MVCAEVVAGTTVKIVFSLGLLFGAFGGGVIADRQILIFLV